MNWNEKIKNVMNEITAKNGGNFGIPKVGNGKRTNQGEALFRDALCSKLNLMVAGWQWTIESRFATTALTNRGVIAIDIVGKNNHSGKSFFIELKYVTHRLDADGANQLRPNDEPAFAYDVLKDCLKLELIHNGRSKSIGGGHSESAGGVVIGLTNWERYWSPVNIASARNWSRESLLTINKPCLGPQIIETVKKPSPALMRTIFHHKRPHISLGAAWKGEWCDLPAVLLNQNIRVAPFRYLLLSSENFNDINYPHRLDDPTCIPFLDVTTRDRFNSLNRSYKRPAKNEPST